MIASRKKWTWAPAKPSAVPPAIKVDVQARAQQLIDSHLTPTYLKPPLKNPKFNYLVGISTMWHGRFFYFVSRYASPGPNTISPFFESGFARLEYQSNGQFNLAYMRHTGQWWEVYTNLTIQEVVNVIAKEPLFNHNTAEQRGAPYFSPTAGKRQLIFLKKNSLKFFLQVLFDNHIFWYYFNISVNYRVVWLSQKK
jgi:hypothetical protein